MGSSLDQAGRLTNSVADAELVHDVISGLDKMDWTTIDEDTYPKLVEKDKYTFGVPKHFLAEGVDPDVQKAFDEHIEMLKKDGHKVIDLLYHFFMLGNMCI